MEKRTVLSIDIGIVNLGYVYAEMSFPDIHIDGSRYKTKCNLKRNNENIRILACDKINITCMHHKRVPYDKCTLMHDNCIPDYLDHFVQEHNMFETCDILLLERQPPVGITNVQDLLFKQFRHKVILISPNTIHSYFGMSSEYDTRKQQSETISKSFLHDQTNFKKHIRKHDISDALLFVLYHYNTLLEHHIDTKMYTKATIDFEQFRFKGSEGT